MCSQNWVVVIITYYSNEIKEQPIGTTLDTVIIMKNDMYLIILSVPSCPIYDGILFRWI